MFLTLYAHLSYFLKDFAFYLILLTISFCLLILSVFTLFRSHFSLKKKKILSSFVFSLFCLVVIFSLFEAYFRYVYDDSDGLGFLKVNQRWHDRHMVFNSSAYRDRDFSPEKKEGVIRIGILGDSIGEGDGVKDVNNRFSNLLEKKLKDAGYNIEVYNISKAGYDFEGEIENYNSEKYLNFDIVVWGNYINDIQPKDKSTGTPIISKNSQEGKILTAVSNKSFFIDYLYWRFSSVYDQTIVALRQADIDQYKNADRLDIYRKEMTDFAKQLKDENRKFAVIIFPSIALLKNPTYPTFINDAMKHQFQQTAVPYVDLYDFLKDEDPKSLMASRFDTHPNEKVHALASEKLFDLVKPLIEEVKTEREASKAALSL